MLFDPDTGEQRIYLSGPNETKFPIAWTNDQEILVLKSHFGPPDDNPTGKWVENEHFLVLLNIQTGQTQVILAGSFGISPNPLSPNGQWLAYNQNLNGGIGLFLYSISDGKTIDLRTDRAFIGWSPDGQWMALHSKNDDVTVLRPDGSGDEKILSISGKNVLVSWFIVSQHLLLIEQISDLKTERDGANISLISIKDKNLLPDEFLFLNTKDFVFDRLFWP